MELKKEYSCFEKNENVFSKTLEIEQDFSETCPAYCDDIFRVVKCVSNSFINSVSVSQNDITVFGKTQIMLTYYNENSVLCYADFEEEFSRSVTAENLSDFAFARAQINDKYTDFRIINQRRIDVHFASVIKLFVYDKQKYPCLENCENAKFFKNSVKSADIIASNISKIEFDEEFSLPSDLPSINRIISANCYAHLDETKIIKDKVLVKASVDSNVLYTSGENEESVNSVSFSFNVSKIIDVSSVDENDIIICDVSAGNIFNKAKSLSGDKICNIELFGDIVINSLFIREKEQEFISDG
ncbi:MAG: DUF3794 domain-containing protein, partial [Eubacterium sp.]|nr:DUF3794 domain-containing protein [Eubacterium sp.]